MAQLFFTIAVAVIAVNFIYMILPDGAYSKYAGVVTGLVVICIIAGSLFHTQLSGEILKFDESLPVFESGDLAEVMQSQTQRIAGERIKAYLEEKYQKKCIEKLEVELSDNVITKVYIKTTDESLNMQMKTDAAGYCDIKIQDVVVE